MIASKWKKNSDFRFWIKSGEYYIYQILWYTLTLLRKFNVSLLIRRLMGLTDQACSSGFCFKIAWKSTWQPYFLQNHSLLFLQGLRSLKNWLLQKLSMKTLEPLCFGLKTLISLWKIDISRNWIFWTLEIKF